jgi:hypothetical protein
MAIDLKEKMLAGFSDKDFIDVRIRTVEMASIISNRKHVAPIRDLMPKINEVALQHMLLNLPVPPVYLLEHQDVTYSILKGAEFIETGAAVVEFRSDYNREQMPLIRRIGDIQVPLVTLRCNMTPKVVARLKEIMGL